MQVITSASFRSKDIVYYAGEMANQIKRIREERMAESDQKLWTQDALASRIGTTGRTLRAWEAARMMPRRFHAIRLAKALGVSIEELGLSDSSGESQDA